MRSILPCTKHPTYFEWYYGRKEKFSYAGCLVHGKIDRIDINPATNRAIVIDYKTSVGADYDAHAVNAPAFSLPTKVQAYIYAKAVQDLLGHMIAAILYINPLKGEIRGAYDSSAIDPGMLPGLANYKRCTVPFADIGSVEEMLSSIEAEIEPRLEKYKQGVISCDPRYKYACRYCAVTRCEERLSS